MDTMGSSEGRPGDTTISAHMKDHQPQPEHKPHHSRQPTMTSSTRKRVLTELDPHNDSVLDQDSQYSESSKRSRNSNWPLPEYNPTPPRHPRTPKRMFPSAQNRSPPISTQAVPPGQTGASVPGRTSKFAEESMHDRPSQQPNSVFLRHDAISDDQKHLQRKHEDLMEEYNEDQTKPHSLTDPKSTNRKKLQAKSPRHGHENPETPTAQKKGGFFRFGNPWNLPRFIKDTWRSSRDDLDAEGRKRLEKRENALKKQEAVAAKSPYRVSFNRTSADVSSHHHHHQDHNQEEPASPDDNMEVEQPAGSPQPGFFRRMISSSNLRHARSEAHIRRTPVEESKTVRVAAHDGQRRPQALPHDVFAPEKPHAGTSDNQKRIRKLQKRKENLDRDTGDTIQAAHGIQAALAQSPSTSRVQAMSFETASPGHRASKVPEPLLDPEQLAGSVEVVVESIETEHHPPIPARNPPSPPQDQEQHDITSNPETQRPTSKVPRLPDARSSVSPSSSTSPPPVEVKHARKTLRRSTRSHSAISSSAVGRKTRTGAISKHHAAGPSNIPRPRRQASARPTDQTDIPVIITPDAAQDIPPVPSIPQGLRVASADQPAPRLRRVERRVVSETVAGKGTVLRKERKQKEWVEDGMGGKRPRAECDEPGWDFPSDVF